MPTLPAPGPRDSHTPTAHRHCGQDQSGRGHDFATGIHLGEARKLSKQPGPPQKGDWPIYESQFLALMKRRRIEQTLSNGLVADGCLLCSEHTPDHCHRRLVADYLGAHWDNVDVMHLG